MPQGGSGAGGARPTLWRQAFNLQAVCRNLDFDLRCSVVARRYNVHTNIVHTEPALDIITHQYMPCAHTGSALMDLHSHIRFVLLSYTDLRIK